jgi:type IV pilus assembly protein PilY1
LQVRQHFKDGRGRILMKRTICTALWLLSGAALLLPTAGFAVNVCSDGVGIPPFLSSGAKPNLLMVLDNSGSMLDPAYSKTDSFCFDDSYDSSKTYAGYFRNDTWYKWTDGAYPPWQKDTSYKDGDRVYANGIIWQVGENGFGTSTGDSIADDTVYWEKVFSVPKWKNAEAYTQGAIVWSGTKLYKAAAAGTSNDPSAVNGLNLADDIGVTWQEVESTWQNGVNYKAGNIVSHKGILYAAAGDGKSSGAGVHDDKGVTWNRLNEGSFIESDEAAAKTHCSSAADSDSHSHADLCISLSKTGTPKRVAAFAARGNLLNWAMASKFDVQKKILTGGKHNQGEKLLVSEHRGCAGSRLVKQLPLAGGKYLALGVRGSKHRDAPEYEDRIDSTDDTSRLEVLAVTDKSYELSGECKKAIDDIIDGKLQGSQQVIGDCLATFPNADSKMLDMHPALNHSLQICWQPEINKGHFDGVIDHCTALYTGTKIGSIDTDGRSYSPAELRPADGGPYICYGVYDSGVDHLNRSGYVGRCWNDAGAGGAAECGPWKPSDCGSSPKCIASCAKEPCYWTYDSNGNPVSESSQTKYKTTGGEIFFCDNGGKKCNVNQWKKVYKSSLGSLHYNATCDGIGGGTEGADWEVKTWPDNQDVPPAPGNCILEAIKDYCDALKVPEVIDPSESSGKTGETAGLPGLIRDSYLMAFLGGGDPIATMKGYIQQPTRPKGIVHNVAKDLRLGVMALHYVGADTECKMPDTSKLEKYCPPNNKDGAELLVPLETGDLVVNENDPTYDGGKRRHVDDLAEAVNSVQGTSWTPLAEALYTALGYYGQNNELCLNKDSGGKCLDFPTDKDPVQYWCQDNHILLITEGESTADINAEVAALATFPADRNHPRFLSDETGDNMNGDEDGAPAVCDQDLYGSNYLDDMAWWGQNLRPLYKARYFTDPDGNQTPKQTVYTHVVTTGLLSTNGTGECSPVNLMLETAQNGGTGTYYPGENPQQLEDNLYAVLDDILSRSSAGSAASVISSSRSGSGAAYQAVFWPKFEDDSEPKNRVSWVGDVHSLFVSSEGLMYEDSDQNGKLDAGVDKRVLFYFSEIVNKTRGCYDVEGFLSNNSKCPNDPVEPCAGGEKDCVEIQDIKYLWSANKRLRAMNVAQDRNIFTWNDANNNGIVDRDKGEWFRLDSNVDWNALNTLAANSGTRGPVTKDFLRSEDVENFVGYDPMKGPEAREQDALKALISWLQGVDQLNDEAADDNSNGRLDKALRSRQFALMERTAGGSMSKITREWRLGDIIHSTPTVVARPAESYHYIYRDPTYADFANRWANRRNMVYFGGNDGMLHAMNGGFYFETGNQFCCTDKVKPDGDCEVSPSYGVCSSGPDLGEEKWAYIPYNLQPHLKCLADKYYAHKYYVDQKPRIFDVQIFKPEAACATDVSSENCIHPGGWGTILVGSMRFGGSPVLASELNGDPNDKREFISSFFILDITNPESDPELLGEMTRTTEKDAEGNDVYVKLNYTTSSPAMSVMRDGAAKQAHSTWYLIMGNGPTDQDATNNNGEHGKLAVLPLAWLKGNVTSWPDGVPQGLFETSKMAFRIPNKLPTEETSQGGVFPVPPAQGGAFISDIISVDYNIDLASSGDDLGARYKTDAVYFGTVDGLDFKKYPEDYLPGVPDQFYWSQGGRLFRLVNKNLDSNDQEVESLPSDWRGTRLLADVKMPVIGAPSIGYDNYNYWVYAGTGRFFGEKDKTDNGWCLDSSTNCAQRSKTAFFGIKEPLKCGNMEMTWDSIGWDVNTQGNNDLAPNNQPGSRGLMQTDNILVESGTGYLHCYHCATDIADPSRLVCSPASGCFGSLPTEAVTVKDPVTGDDKTVQLYTFKGLQKYIAGSGCDENSNATGLDGWYHAFHDPRERNLGTSALLGGLLTFTTYQPFNDKCKAEGQSYLYGVHFQTGTAWTQTVFGTFDKNDNGHTSYQKDGGQFVMDKMSLGRGLSTTPSMHVGTGKNAAKAFIQTSTGEIIEVTQENLPFPNTRSGRQNWTDRRGEDTSH